METIKGYTLTKEETDACLELVQKMRKERAQKRAIALYRQQIEDLVNTAVDVIGMIETKQIIRHINRNLRGVDEISTD